MTFLKYLIATLFSFSFAADNVCLNHEESCVSFTVDSGTGCD